MSRMRSTSPEQFQALKSKIREITGVPASRWENVTTVMYKQYFDPERVSVITPVDKGYRKAAWGRENRRDLLDVDAMQQLTQYNMTVEEVNDGYYLLVSAPLADFDVSSKPKDYKSWWVTWAHDLRSTVYGVGVDTDPEYKTPLKQVATRLGERQFYEFAASSGQRFSSYGQLRNFLQKKLSSYNQNSIPSEAELVELAENDRYIKIVD